MNRQFAMPALVMETGSVASGRTLLMRRLAEVRDPRDVRGRRFSMVSLLLVALCATAAGFGSYRAMAQWAQAAGAVTRARLGLRAYGAFGLVRAPSADTVRRALTVVRPGDLEVLLRARDTVLETVAADGKVLRGSRDQASGAVTLVGAMAQDGTLVAQLKVAGKSNEIPALAPLLSVLDLRGVVVTADALHTQVESAKVLVQEMGAHFVLTVKRNQPTLWEACRSIPWKQVTARHKAGERGHGRLETRVVQAVTWTDLEFPHVRQVARITRHRTERATGKRTRETVYVITDLSAHEASPQDLGRYARGHWGVENKIHYVRDVTFGEDASPSGPATDPERLDVEIRRDELPPHHGYFHRRRATTARTGPSHRTTRPLRHTH